MIRILLWRESHFGINTRVRRKRKIQKNRTVRVTVRDLSREFNLSKVVLDRKIVTFQWVYHFHHNG